jgi:hypothetical protein
MTEINIDPTKEYIEVQITSQSLHALGFEVIVYAPDGSTVIEKFTGDTRVNNPFTQTLKLNPSDSKGTYISGTFTVSSPDGRDYPYSIVFSILEDNNLIKPNITLTGTTSGGQGSSIENYHLN